MSKCRIHLVLPGMRKIVKFSVFTFAQLGIQRFLSQQPFSLNLSNLKLSKWHIVIHVSNCVPPFEIKASKSSFSGLDKHVSVKPAITATQTGRL